MPAYGESGWVEVSTVKELSRRRKLKVETEDGGLVVLWHDGCPYALANICVHQDRELSNGTLLGRRVVCPGHQWAFDVETGYCKERDRYQPVHAARVEGDVVYVDPVPTEIDRDG